MSEFIAEPTSRKNIRNLTRLIRDQFELSDERYFPVIPFLEFGLSQIDSDFSLEIAPKNEMPNDYALTFPETNKIKIRQDVYDRAIDGVPRDRFTIAHEIGHYIMHRPGFFALARNHNKEKIPSYKDPEWQANTFAGEILAPLNIIKGLTKEEVSRQCGVSLKVAEIQLNKL
ncbi:ImmA/IrrE family metallo-endopeptidase [Gracilibacillus xinjiangensis]|uniref:ImmA/IrrE family metallo-endopeptidase n=1 Tax=Gracilibacillus xinjiangensis TaxID=1193282 RepID=A0ABV8WTY5_9BACI